MKKSVLFGLLSVLLVFTSCKSKESAYKLAYEKAKAQETTQVQVNAPMQVTPVEATVVEEDNYLLPAGIPLAWRLGVQERTLHLYVTSVLPRYPRRA